jgi:hypothetical protein
MRPGLLTVTVACAALACVEPLAIGPRVVGPISPPRAYVPDDWGSCADATDPCCTSIAQLDAARARGDDKTADEQLERLALACPERTKGVLERWAVEDRARCPEDLAATTQFYSDYRIHIAREDRLVWVATYFDRARPRWFAPAGARELVVEVEIVSGEPPDAGKLVRLRDTQPLALTPGDAGRILIELERQPGPEPFRLGAQLELRPQKVHFTRCPPHEGTIGLGGRSARYPSVVPPPFDPPRELRAAGAPWGRGEICDRSQRGTTIYLIGGGAGHPRRKGASLDWLRRFEYEPWAGGTCESVDLDFTTGNPAER